MEDLLAVVIVESGLIPLRQPHVSSIHYLFGLGIPVQNGVGGTTLAESRKRRRDGLNAVLDINKKTKTGEDEQNSLRYWEQLKDYFPPIVQGSIGASSSAGLPDPLLSALHQYLSFATICVLPITEAKRIHLIAPIVMIVGSHFHGDIQILAEEDIEGNRVHAYEHFDFVLKRGEKRICIVEAKKDDILQSRTQSLIGCESLCDIEELSVTYGIATNYLEWCFIKDEADKVTEELLTVSLENGRPTVESLRTIANKIIAILE
eukprot:scaffold6125_cov262-Ochromonas_danica.AAC.4